ncbi:MAG: type II secretion system protein GspE, partial [Chlamydiota bacterium]
YTPLEQELKELNLRMENLADGKLYKGQGCIHCFGSGFKGRHAIYELMPVTTAIKRQLLRSADAVELQRTALAEGMSNLRKEGAILAAQKLTSSSEVLRVTRGCEEV